MKKFSDSVRDFVIEWTINILILLFGTTTLVQAFIVPTPSMDTTVRVGDHLLVDKLSYAPPGSITKHLLPYTEPQRGDIIVFRWPIDINQNYVKRLIGKPGDRIHLENKTVFLNGHALVEPYVQHIDPTPREYRDNFPKDPWSEASIIYDRAQQMLHDNTVNGEIVVPDGFYFAMGDNRDNSSDSRYWGFVPRENIIGKPLLIFWSYDAPTSDLVDYTANHFIDLALHFFT